MTKDLAASPQLPTQGMVLEDIEDLCLASVRLEDAVKFEHHRRVEECQDERDAQLKTVMLRIGTLYEEIGRLRGELQPSEAPAAPKTQDSGAVFGYGEERG